MNKLVSLNNKIVDFIAQIDIPLFVLRLVLAKIFFDSGMTKLDNFEQAVFLFEYEYALPLISPTVAAFMAMIVEIGAPILLFLGLFTRYSALALLVMSMVIQFLVYTNNEHYFWMLLSGLIMVKGSGKISLEYLLEKKFSFKF